MLAQELVCTELSVASLLVGRVDDARTLAQRLFALSSTPDTPLVRHLPRDVRHFIAWWGRRDVGDGIAIGRDKQTEC
jgi:hypothetical protein